MMLIWLVTAAFAVEPTSFPWRASVDLPSDGVHRIDVPSSLRSAEDPPNGSDFLLVNGAGEPVQIAWLRGPQGVQNSVRPGEGNLVVVPEGDRRWRITVRERPIDGLKLDMARWAPVIADVSLTELDGTAVSGPHRVWSVGGRNSLEVPLPPRTGSWLLTTTSPQIFGARVRDLTGIRWEVPPAPEERFVLPLSTPTLTENGMAQYDLVLDRPLPIKGVTVRPTNPVYERNASLGGADDGDRYKAASWSGRDRFVNLTGPMTPIKGIRLADTRVNDAWVARSGPVSDLLTLNVSTEGKAALDIPEVEVVMDGLVALVQDPGPGPHTLYAGARPGTSPSWDLQIAAADLGRIAQLGATVGDAEPNPDFVPLVQGAGLVDPGAELVLRGYTWRRAIQGSGMSRMILPAEVLVGSRSDLGDLRVIDAEGRQIPYVLRERATPQLWPDLVPERVEDGHTSVLEIPLPVASAPIGTVTLRTSSTMFRRSVSVGRPSGGGTQIMRAVNWNADERPGVLTLYVGTSVGDRIVVRIDNGDNPPLPIDSVDVGWPTWELVTHVPDGGATLVYGNSRAYPPSYDLRWASQAAFSSARAEATLGPQEPWAGPEKTGFDRVAILGGMGLLMGGLVWLTLQLIRATPERAEDAPAS